MNHTIKAILFDLDDTLYDEMTFVSSGFLAVANYLVSYCNLLQSPAVLHSEMLNLEVHQGRGRIFDDIVEAYNLSTKLVVATLVDVYRNHHPHLHLYPDVKSTLRTLRECGYFLGLITDGLYTVQRQKVAALGLESRLDIIIFTDELGREFWKPHPAAFERALEYFQIAPHQAVYVGNDPTKDFAGPHRLGMVAIQIHRPGKRALVATDADVQIKNLQDLLDYLDGNDGEK